MSTSTGLPNSSRQTEDERAQLEWIRFREDTLGEHATADSSGSKLFRKMKENPFVPAGALLTTFALGYGLLSFRQGKPGKSQSMMRLRVGAQGFTIVALLVGVMLHGTTK